jgi:GT2 family glycosyltransferase
MLYIDRISEICVNKFDVVIIDNGLMREGHQFLLHEGIPFCSCTLYQLPVYRFNYSRCDIALVESNENGGYAKGNNLGAKVSDCIFNNEYYIFSNNDIIFHDSLNFDFMKVVIEENSEIAIIGPNILSMDGNPQNPRMKRGFISQVLLWDFNILLLKGKLTRFVWNLDYTKEGKFTGWVSGSFMFVKRYPFIKVGGFDENTFLYAEEMILSEKLRNIGFKTYYYPCISLIHRHKGTNTFNLRKISHISKRYYYKYYENTNEILCILSDVAFYLIESIYFCLRTCKANVSKIFIFIAELKKTKL